MIQKLVDKHNCACRVQSSSFGVRRDLEFLRNVLIVLES